MEAKVCGSKCVSTSEIIQAGRANTTRSSSFCHKVGVTRSRISTKVICSRGNLTAEIIPSYANGINGFIGAKPFLRSRNVRVLDACDDEYGGVVIDPRKLPSDPSNFARALHYSLSYWKKTGKKGVWLKLLLQNSDLVPVAVKGGFQYHHAEKEYVMMTYWIPEGPCLLPDNASHQVGVGGFILNDNNEILVVQEKHYPPELDGLWKIPTGFILEEEEIYAGAIREVKEETGIDTEFVEIIAFRHAHNVAFDKSDLLFVCMLRPLSTEIDIDDVEVAAAKWMPLVEFVKQPSIQGDSMFKRIIDVCIARLEKRYCGLSYHQLISKFDGKSSSLYYNVLDAHNTNCIGN